jgi:predicted nucleic acid-binding protein
VRFWDASAVVPLLVSETVTGPVLDLLEQDPSMIVWWGTPIECASAVARREREGSLSSAGVTEALARLRQLAAAWQEIEPVEQVRTTAQRLLRVHPLRAADSLQLAAAVIAAEHETGSLPFVCLDDRLAGAAEREGFPVVAATVGT